MARVVFWNQLGFEDDIFFVQPLLPQERDLRMFVGREQETGEFMKGLARSSRGLILVGGDTGVGKTSFVNMQQFMSNTQKVNVCPGVPGTFPVPRLLASPTKIQLTEDDSIRDLVIKCISSAVQAVERHCIGEGIGIPERAKQINLWCNEAIISSGGGVGISTPIGGIQATAKAKTVNTSLVDPRKYIEELVDVVQNELKLDGLILVINNLETLPTEWVASFVDQARDQLFTLAGVFWILIGNAGIGSFLTAQTPRISDYLSVPEVTLKPLTAEHFAQIVQARVSVLGKPGSAKSPIEPGLLPLIYGFAGNELRAAIQLAGDIVLTVYYEYPSASIDFDIFFKFINKVAMRRFEQSSPSQSQTRILVRLVANLHCRPRDHKAYGFESAASFMPHLQNLLSKRLISRIQDGTAVYYKPTGMTILAAAGGALGQETMKFVTAGLGKVLSSAISSRPPDACKLPVSRSVAKQAGLFDEESLADPQEA